MAMSGLTKERARILLTEAERKNPGLWASHSVVAAQCAEKIASKCKELDQETAYIMGILHDIGRRFGSNDLQHIIAGYDYLMELGHPEYAKICLSHSFPCKILQAYAGQNDCSKAQNEFIQTYLEEQEWDDYDKLIQLCDALALPTGPVIIEKRLVNVVMRKGFNEHTLTKWKEYFNLKEYFDRLSGDNIYHYFDLKF